MNFIIFLNYYCQIIHCSLQVKKKLKTIKEGQSYIYLSTDSKKIRYDKILNEIVENTRFKRLLDISFDVIKKTFFYEIDNMICANYTNIEFQNEILLKFIYMTLNSAINEFFCEINYKDSFFNKGYMYTKIFNNVEFNDFLKYLESNTIEEKVRNNIFGNIIKESLKTNNTYYDTEKMLNISFLIYDVNTKINKNNNKILEMLKKIIKNIYKEEIECDTIILWDLKQKLKQYKPEASKIFNRKNILSYVHYQNETEENQFMYLENSQNLNLNIKNFESTTLFIRLDVAFIIENTAKNSVNFKKKELIHNYTNNLNENLKKFITLILRSDNLGMFVDAIRDSRVFYYLYDSFEKDITKYFANSFCLNKINVNQGENSFLIREFSRYKETRSFILNTVRDEIQNKDKDDQNHKIFFIDEKCICYDKTNIQSLKRILNCSSK